MSRKLFFSDCHISAGLGVTAGGDNEHAWEWLTPRDHQRLQAFASGQPQGLGPLMAPVST
jgi:hypothetical protein